MKKILFFIFIIFLLFSCLSTDVISDSNSNYEIYENDIIYRHPDDSNILWFKTVGDIQEIIYFENQEFYLVTAIYYNVGMQKYIENCTIIEKDNDQLHMNIEERLCQVIITEYYHIEFEEVKTYITLWYSDRPSLFEYKIELDFYDYLEEQEKNNESIEIRNIFIKII